MGKALDGVRVLDMTHVQSGPTCTQILAWFGADVIKVERPGEGDPTRGQLRDIPGVDSLYFTMLNANKRGITLNPKTEMGKKIFTKLIEECDVMVENFAPGAIDRMGFPWETIQKINPRMIYASVKGFGPGPFEDCKVYENVAQLPARDVADAGPLDLDHVRPHIGEKLRAGRARLHMREVEHLDAVERLASLTPRLCARLRQPI